MTRILILCTGNSCRSQMAEAFLRSFDPNLDVVSAGTHPAPSVHPHAVTVMNELGIVIKGTPKNVDRFVQQQFDYVVTVCDNAREACPTFIGSVRHRLHIGFDDPAEATGSEAEILSEFRRVRDEIKERFTTFLNELAGH